MALGSGCMTRIEFECVNEWGDTCVQLLAVLIVRPPEPALHLQECEPIMVTEASYDGNDFF